MEQDRQNNRPMMKSQSTSSSTSQLLQLDFDNNNELMDMGENCDDDIPNVFWDEYDDHNSSIPPVPYDELGNNRYSIQPLDMKQSLFPAGPIDRDKSETENSLNQDLSIQPNEAPSQNRNNNMSADIFQEPGRPSAQTGSGSNQQTVDIAAAFNAAGLNPALAQQYLYSQSIPGSLFPFGMQLGTGAALDSRNFSPLMYPPIPMQRPNSSQTQSESSGGQQSQQQQMQQQQQQQMQKNQAQMQALNYLSRSFQQTLWSQAQQQNINQNQMNQQAVAQQALQYLLQNSQGQIIPQPFVQFSQNSQSLMSNPQQQIQVAPLIQQQSSNKQQPKQIFIQQSKFLERNQTNDGTTNNVVSSSETDCEHSNVPSTTAVAAKKSKAKRARVAMNLDVSNPIPQVVNSFSSYQDTMSSVTNSNNSSSHRDFDATDGIEKDSKIRTHSLSFSEYDDDDHTNEHDDVNDDHLTPVEKADANRRRNREHARNTRAKKKAYLESLKSTLDVLCRERDSLLSERACAATHLVEVQKIRTEVLMAFFALRCMNESKRSLWSSILEESVTCVLPVTPYRSFPASEVQISKCQRTILGIDGIMADSASLHVLLNTLVDRAMYPNEDVQFKYTFVSEEAVVSGDQIMARWEMTTTNASKIGAKKELKKVGMLCTRFNSRHKIVALELIFDVMAFMLQLKQSARKTFLSVVPNTVQTCVGPFGDTPMVMTLAEPPYTIVHVNEHWEAMTGYKSEDVVGKHSCKILQGAGSEQKALNEFSSSIQYQRPANISITNYTRDKKPFRNYFNLYPLSTDSKITHFVALTLHFGFVDENDNLSQSQSMEGDLKTSSFDKSDDLYDEAALVSNNAASSDPSISKSL